MLKSENKAEVGPTVGADFGALSFEDVDHDGVQEAIIESDGSFAFEEYSHEKHTLEYQRGSAGKVRFTLFKSEVREWPLPYTTQQRQVAVHLGQEIKKSVSSLETNFSVAALGIEPKSRASETLILSVVRRGRYLIGLQK